MRRTVPGALCLLLLAVLLTTLSVRPGLAEDPKEAALAAIDQGRTALAAGKTQAAIDHLQKAIALMQQMAVKGLASFLPATPKGWKAPDPVVNSGSWGVGEQAYQWNSASRTYTREADQVTAEVVISTSPQLVESQRAMMKVYRDPLMLKMMNQDPSQKVEVAEKDGWQSLTVIKEGENATVTACKGECILTLAVSNGSSRILREFWDAIDLAGLSGTLSTGDEEADEPEDE